MRNLWKKEYFLKIVDNFLMSDLDISKTSLSFTEDKDLQEEELQVFSEKRPPGLLWKKTSRSSLEEYLRVFYGRRTAGPQR